MITRSKAQPSAPATDIAASIATKIAARFSHTESTLAQSTRPAITLVATKAPKAMKTPWPKLSTSIRPNTSVSPEAMTNTISPIARPAAVSVSQVDGEPISGSAEQRHHGDERERDPVEARRRHAAGAAVTMAEDDGGAGGVASGAAPMRETVSCCVIRGLPGTARAAGAAAPRRRPGRPSRRHAPRGRRPSPRHGRRARAPS